MAGSFEGEGVRIIKVFVSSPGDVADARKVMEEVIASINGTDGETRDFRLELFRWEKDVVPKVGPEPQKVVDGQTSAYDIYLGIMSTRFGTPTGRYGSGTEKEFRDALRNWNQTGKPWIMFYFDAQPKLTGNPEQAKHFVQVCEFREELEKRGIVATYTGVRGSADSFKGKVSIHLRKVVRHMPRIQRDNPEQGKPPSAGTSGKSVTAASKKPVVPPEYLAWLPGQCCEMELMGLQVKHGSSVRLNHVYTPLTTSTRPRLREEPVSKLPTEALERENAPSLLLDLLNEGSLYVSGDPGAGKSTFCRWVTWLICNGAMPPADVHPPENCQEKFPELLRGRLPLLVCLRDFWPYLPSSGVRAVGLAGLEEALAKWLTERKMPGMDPVCLKSHLEAGLAVLILDGVDEVPSIRRADENEWYPREMLLGVLPEAADRWTKAGNRVLVTSRPYGVDSRRQERLGLFHAPIQGLDEELQALLVRRWFVRLGENRDRGVEKAGDMIGHLHRERNLDALAANPLLLTAMCVIYDEGKRLPQDRYELYERIVETVLYKRYEQRERLEAIRGRLQAIALGMHTGEAFGQRRENPEASASNDEIDRLLSAYRKVDGATDSGLGDIVRVREDLLSQSGLLVSRGDGHASFYHLSFQEFLAAGRLFVLQGLKGAQCYGLAEMPDRQGPAAGWRNTLPFLFDYLMGKVNLQGLKGPQCDGVAEIFVRRGRFAGWRNTLSFFFGCLISRINTHAGVEYLRSVIEARSFADDLSGRGRGGSVWNLAIVLGDCLEILRGRGTVVPEELSAFFRDAAMRAIEREISVKERHALAVVLGRLGDPRIVEDLRAGTHPDEHPGYVRIPEGKYYYGDSKEPFEIAEPFRLSRYPVTNSQYALFLKDGGYGTREFWSEEGWLWREKESISEPRYWRDPGFCAPNQPVVGVSFWESEAFARWTGGALPMERQWEAAARGPEGYVYPWGDKWEDGICNSSEAGLGGTSSVGIFPRSKSRPFGLEDMAGNVWEWCVDVIGVSVRVIRGGRWGSVAGSCRSANRDRDEPWLRYFGLGFRVAQFPPCK